MEPDKRPKRKGLLIHKEYQVRFAIEILVVIVAATFISTLMAYFLTNRELKTGFFSVHRSLQDIQQLLLPVLMMSALVTLVAMAILAIYIILKQTHRVVGPARRMEAKFLEMSEGNFELMHSFRQGDVLKGLDDFINQHLNNMSDYFVFLERSMQSADDLLDKLESGKMPSGECAEMLREELAEMDKYATAFRTG